MAINMKAKLENLAYIIFCFIVVGIIAAGCSEGSEGPVLGEEYINSQSTLVSIDTFSVELSTVMFDDLITSNSGIALVGNFNDSYFGKISSKSYMQFGIPSDNDVQGIDRYDSLHLVLEYTGYFFGDTTQIQQLNVYKLNEKIEYDNGQIIHSGTGFNFDPTPIGSVKYKPKPNSSPDTLAIKLNDEIGMDLFTKLYDDSESIQSADNFIDYFKGIMIAADDGSEVSIIGFKSLDDEIKLKLFTTRESLPEVEIVYDFGLYDDSKQFNQYTHDFTSTYLESIGDQSTALPSAQAGGLAFLQGGIGTAIRVDFPTLNELLLYQRGTIVDAHLQIAPAKKSFDVAGLPDDLYAYTTDEINRITEQISSPGLSIDELYQEETFYSFDLTNFISDLVTNGYIESDLGIMITLSPDDDLGKTFNRLVVDANHMMTKLKIYYLIY